METITSYTHAQLKLGKGISDIATPIARNYGLWHDLDDICQETRLRLLEDYGKYSGNAGYLQKMSDQQYYNKAVRNKVIQVCELRSDPFTYYYQPDWLRDNLDRLLDVAMTESEVIEIADFKRALDTVTPKQRDAILNGERSGNASEGIKKLVRNMNKGKCAPYVDVTTLD
jgi:DNA-directed RNA polymerase specialized sigma24 family protein